MYRTTVRAFVAGLLATSLLSSAAMAASPVTPTDNAGHALVINSDGSLNTNATIPAVPASYASTSALASSKVVKASAGTLYTFNVTPDATLNAGTWFVLIFDATSAPVDGAVTPVKCYTVPTGVTSFNAGWPANGLTFTAGITIAVSTTGCFTKTASAHAFISGDFR